MRSLTSCSRVPSLSLKASMPPTRSARCASTPRRDPGCHRRLRGRRDRLRYATRPGAREAAPRWGRGLGAGALLFRGPRRAALAASRSKALRVAGERRRRSAWPLASSSRVCRAAGPGRLDQTQGGRIETRLHWGCEKNGPGVRPGLFTGAGSQPMSSTSPERSVTTHRPGSWTSCSRVCVVLAVAIEAKIALAGGDSPLCGGIRGDLSVSDRGRPVNRSAAKTWRYLAATRAGIPVRGLPATVAWLSEADDQAARERWPGWVDSLAVDEPVR